jgi:hypothetical protein
MKTFEEAITAVCHPRAETDAETRLIGLQLEENAARCDSIAQEAQQNEQYQALLKAWIELGANGMVRSAFFSAFMAGLVTGMEMEKA